MTATCPKGHSSTEEDFCSECGAKITDGNMVASQGAPKVASSDTCPDCHTPRARDTGKFCELCGFNFESGAHGEIPMAPPVSAAVPAAAVETALPAQEKWTVHIAIDPSLKENGSPDPPADWNPVTLSAERDTLLIGRTSRSKNILPEIALDFDSAVSHRHAVLTRVNGNDWAIRDIGSSNGTRVNGQELQAMVDVPVKPGDRVTLGHWTCLTISSDSQ